LSDRQEMNRAITEGGVTSHYRATLMRRRESNKNGGAKRMSSAKDPAEIKQMMAPIKKKTETEENKNLEADSAAAAAAAAADDDDDDDVNLNGNTAVIHCRVELNNV
jgi:predicted DNA-binding helix-hairpin-helix protein